MSWNFLSSVMDVASGGSGGGAGAMKDKYNTGALSDKSPVNIAPIGVNVGEILKPYNQGSVENGGFGLEYPSRLMPLTASLSSNIPTKGISGWFWPVIIGLGGLVVLTFARGR